MNALPRKATSPSAINGPRQKLFPWRKYLKLRPDDSDPQFTTFEGEVLALDADLPYHRLYLGTLCNASHPFTAARIKLQFLLENRVVMETEYGFEETTYSGLWTGWPWDDGAWQSIPRIWPVSDQSYPGTRLYNFASDVVPSFQNEVISPVELLVFADSVRISGGVGRATADAIGWLLADFHSQNVRW